MLHTEATKNYLSKMAPVRVRQPEKLGPNALKLYKSNFNNLTEVHKTKQPNINLRNEFLRNWERMHRQNLFDTYESMSVHPGLAGPGVHVAAHKARLLQAKGDLKTSLDEAGVFRDSKKGVLAY